MESALRQVVGQSTMDEVLTLKRSEIALAMKEQIINTLKNYHTGIRVLDVVMQFAKPPEEVRAAFDEVIKALADEERLVNQARAYENEILPKAKGTAERLRNEALGYKQETILIAEGNVQRFNLVLPQYLKAPKVTQTRLYLDALEQILARTSKVIVNAGEGNNLIYLPLDRLMTEKQNSDTIIENNSAVNPLKEPLSSVSGFQKEKNP
jgi:membrane protease subunit HflK